MKVTVLGCGSSLGVPAAGGVWGKCDPENPKNHRTRASILVQSETTDILIDTTVDLREQLNRVEQKKLDAVLLSHDHSDHINGIDDLRSISKQMEKLIDVYGNQETIEELTRRYPYLTQGSSGGVYTPPHSYACF